MQFDQGCDRIDRMLENTFCLKHGGWPGETQDRTGGSEWSLRGGRPDGGRAPSAAECARRSLKCELLVSGLSGHLKASSHQGALYSLVDKEAFPEVTKSCYQLGGSPVELNREATLEKLDR